MASAEDIERLAIQLRDTYVTTRKLTTPTYRSNRKDDKHWLSLARQVLANNLNGDHCVRWLYDFYTIHRPTAYPAQITSPKSVMIYMERGVLAPRDRRNELILKIKIQLETIKQYMGLGWSLRTILEDASFEINPVIRYVVASSGGLQDLVEKFRVEAERAVALEPIYNQIFGDVLSLKG